MTTLELRGPSAEIQLRIISRGEIRERRALVRSFLVQIRPWLRHFKSPVIGHSGRGLTRELPTARGEMKVFQSNPVSTLPGAFGYAIRMKRFELGLSQAQLAHILEIQRSHLSDIERGIHLPNAQTRLKIEDRLKIRPL